MKAAMIRTGLVLFLFGIVQFAGGCIMEDRVIELVVNETTCAEFQQDETSVSFVTPKTVDYAAEINEILDDNDISRKDLVSARLVSATYGVTDFPTHADWVITGSITVQREDSTASADMVANTLWDYESVSVSAALGKKIPAVLNSDGVGVLNRALDDFIAGRSPVLTFKVVNSGVTPAPSAGDHLLFAWNGCIVVDFVAKTDVEIPDPF
jgi:hypothetical protein